MKFNSNKDWSLESLLERVIFFTLLHLESVHATEQKNKEEIIKQKGGGGQEGKNQHKVFSFVGQYKKLHLS